MNLYKVISTGEVELYQYIKAETEAEALKLYEDSDISLDNIDEESLSGLRYERIELKKENVKV